MLSITDAVRSLVDEQGLSRYQIAKDIGSSTSMITKYYKGDIHHVSLRIAVKFYKVYGLQIMPYSVEELSGIHRENK